MAYVFTCETYRREHTNKCCPRSCIFYGVFNLVRNTTFIKKCRIDFFIVSDYFVGNHRCLHFLLRERDMECIVRTCDFRGHRFRKLPFTTSFFQRICTLSHYGSHTIVCPYRERILQLRKNDDLEKSTVSRRYRNNRILLVYISIVFVSEMGIVFNTSPTDSHVQREKLVSGIRLLLKSENTAHEWHIFSGRGVGTHVPRLFETYPIQYPMFKHKVSCRA